TARFTRAASRSFESDEIPDFSFACSTSPTGIRPRRTCVLGPERRPRSTAIVRTSRRLPCFDFEGRLRGAILSDLSVLLEAFLCVEAAAVRAIVNLPSLNVVQIDFICATGMRQKRCPDKLCHAKISYGHNLSSA